MTVEAIGTLIGFAFWSAVVWWIAYRRGYKKAYEDLATGLRGDR